MNFEYEHIKDINKFKSNIKKYQLSWMSELMDGVIADQEYSDEEKNELIEVIANVWNERDKEEKDRIQREKIEARIKAENERIEARNRRKSEAGRRKQEANREAKRNRKVSEFEDKELITQYNILNQNIDRMVTASHGKKVSQESIKKYNDMKEKRNSLKEEINKRGLRVETNISEVKLSKKERQNIESLYVSNKKIKEMSSERLEEEERDLNVLVARLEDDLGKSALLSDAQLNGIMQRLAETKVKLNVVERYIIKNKSFEDLKLESDSIDSQMDYVREQLKNLNITSKTRTELEGQLKKLENEKAVYNKAMKNKKEENKGSTRESVEKIENKDINSFIDIDDNDENGKFVEEQIVNSVENQEEFVVNTEENEKIVNPDGSFVIQRANGEVETHFLNGDTEIKYPDGKSVYVFPSGEERYFWPDGEIDIHYPDGKTIFMYPDGEEHQVNSDGRMFKKQEDKWYEILEDGSKVEVLEKDVKNDGCVKYQDNGNGKEENNLDAEQREVIDNINRTIQEVREQNERIEEQNKKNRLKKIGAIVLAGITAISVGIGTLWSKLHKEKNAKLPPAVSDTLDRVNDGKYGPELPDGLKKENSLEQEKEDNKDGFTDKYKVTEEEIKENQEKQKKEFEKAALKQFELGSTMKLPEGMEFSENVFGGEVGTIGNSASPKDGVYVINRVAEVNQDEILTQYGLEGKFEKNLKDSKMYVHIAYVPGAKTVEEAKSILEKQGENQTEQNRGWVELTKLKKAIDENIKQQNNQNKDKNRA